MRNESPCICLIEDDQLMGEALCERFEMESITHTWHKRGRDALADLRRQRYDVVVSDMRLPDISGEDVFVQLRQGKAEVPPFLFMTAFGAIDQAVRLLKLGAADYIAKPLEIDDLIRKIRELSEPTPTTDAGTAILGVAPSMRRIEHMLQRLATSDGSVLITGESGVGKEHVARRLHELAQSAGPKPFVAVNCAAIPETMLEAEMFGFEKGAFTGAAKERRGYFEQADGGILFLDEVGDMPLATQAKLLRAIQERTVTRLGSETPIRVSVQLVCATHEDLLQLAEAGRFREDLYYRINVVSLRVPPLRERREDILWLAKRFAAQQSAKKAGGASFTFTPAAERALLSYPWPGNIRQLKHCIERACILADRSQLTPDALLGHLPACAPSTSGSGNTLIAYLDACEKSYIEDVLAVHAWRVGVAADALGISRKTLWEKMRKHSIADRTKGSSS
ncbi:sigma-54 dependent transcriptional regulator [Sulfuritalea sp.]|uniref:sigma-54-dependent transcriptional regulator n=1 Tax=Sulfuritalea sp. TaxID=2480090 RepID=UPI00286E8BF7|nr:sigma-54 dependent transcriptional regulator [Sulfuritalea sp.]